MHVRLICAIKFYLLTYLIASHAARLRSLRTWLLLPIDKVRSDATKRYAPVSVSAISGGCTATMTSGLDFQHWVSYYSAGVTIALNCTVYRGMGQTDRQTDGRTDGRIAALVKAPLMVEINQSAVFGTVSTPLRH